MHSKAPHLEGEREPHHPDSRFPTGCYSTADPGHTKLLGTHSLQLELSGGGNGGKGTVGQSGDSDPHPPVLPLFPQMHSEGVVPFLLTIS
jgi:hypothetical protein